MSRTIILVVFMLTWIPLDCIFSTQVKASLIGSLAAGGALFAHWVYEKLGLNQ